MNSSIFNLCSLSAIATSEALETESRKTVYFLIKISSESSVTKDQCYTQLLLLYVACNTVVHSTNHLLLRLGYTAYINLLESYVRGLNKGFIWSVRGDKYLLALLRVWLLLASSLEPPGEECGLLLVR